jgi:DNA (cytosine-5)-methyltransferase 1
MRKKPIRYLDLFAGAGGLSEGFIRAGFAPVAHVESDQAAACTLRTRMAYHHLRSAGDSVSYRDYLRGAVTRQDLYGKVPEKVMNSVINDVIGGGSLRRIFRGIDELIGSGGLDLIIGGPPCQAYSLVGRSRSEDGMISDKRNYLFRYYAKFLERYKPRYFVFENVSGLLSARDCGGKLYFDAMRDLFRKTGYETEYMTLNAEDYGVLQNRKRVILVGKRGNKEGFYPEPEKLVSGALVKEVFSDLPFISAGQGTSGPSELKRYNGTWLYETGIRDDDVPVTLHYARPNTEQDLEIYRIAVDLWNDGKRRLDYNDLPERLKTHSNRSSFVDRFKVVAADLPSSHTVVAHISKDGHYYIHPDKKQNRSITPREAARLQSFPDDYFFESASGSPSRTAAFRQIGNAVPVLLAQKIAEKLKEEW